MENRLCNKQQGFILCLLPESAGIKIGLLIKTFQMGPVSSCNIFREKPQRKWDQSVRAWQITPFVLNGISKTSSHGRESNAPSKHSTTVQIFVLFKYWFPYPLQVQRQKQPRDMTSHGAGVWISFYQTSLRSAAWRSHWRKHHRPPWERKEPDTQLDFPSLYCNSIRET